MLNKLTNMPEVNFFVFAFLINFVWEMQQMPLFRFSGANSLGKMNWICTQASLADAFMIVLAFWIVCVVEESRNWFFNITKRKLFFFLIPGLILTVFLELLNTKILQRWEYIEAMPTFPWLDVGVVPIIQWILLPPLILMIVRRQLT